MPFEPIVPKGQHLGTSHEVDGTVTGHLFSDDENKLQGHAAWRYVEEPEEDYSSNYQYEPPRELTPEERELLEKLAAMILVGVIIGVKAAAPHVERWWNEKVIPTAKSVWKRVNPPQIRKRKGVPAAPSSVSQATFVASATGVEIAIADSKIRMSSAEWGHRFRAMLAAGAFKEEQLRILSNARIEEGETALEAQTVAEQLTPQQFLDSIKLMLEANPSPLDDETSAELIRVFSARQKLLTNG